MRTRPRSNGSCGTVAGVSAALVLLRFTSSSAHAAEPQPGPALADLPANTWAYLAPEPTKRLIPIERKEDAKLREVVRGEPARREYSSPVYADGKLYYFGGGHGGYPGNDVEVYDVASNTWAQSYPPECPPVGDSTYYSGGSEAISPTRKPYVLHGYARTSFDPVAKRYVCSATKSLAAYDPATRAWTWIAGKHAPGGEPAMPIPDGNQISIWDDALGGFLMWGHYDFNGVWLFKDGAFVERKHPGVSFAAAGGALFTYIPPLKSHLIATLPHGDAKFEPHVYLYDSVGQSAREVKSLPAELAKNLRPLGNVAFGYDTRNARVIVLSTRDGRIIAWSFDPAADTWEPVPPRPGNDAPKLPTFEPGVGRGPGPFQYDPIHNVFLLVIQGKDHEEVATWAYRYR